MTFYRLLSPVMVFPLLGRIIDGAYMGNIKRVLLLVLGFFIFCGIGFFWLTEYRGYFFVYAKPPPIAVTLGYKLLYLHNA
jgi:hypothetical protein